MKINEDEHFHAFFIGRSMGLTLDVYSLESSLVIPVNRKSTSFGSIPTGSYQFLLDLVGSPGPTVKCSGDMARSREIVSQPPHFSGAICQL